MHNIADGKDVVPNTSSANAEQWNNDFLLLLLLQVQGLQQEVQKLDRQVDKQQSELMSAEHTIMSLSSSKVGDLILTLSLHAPPL